MHSTVKLLIAIVSFEVMSAFSFHPRAPRTLQPTGCDVVGRSDSALILQDVKFFVTDTTLDTLRSESSIPVVPRDSIQIRSGGGACDSAAEAYRLYRVGRGDPDVLKPMILVRLGGSTMFFGTSPRLKGEVREYVLLDSTFKVVSTVGVGP